MCTGAGDVIFAAVAFVGGLDVGASGDAELGAVQAVEAAADGLDPGAPENLRVLRREGGAAQETVVSDGGISEEPIPARLGWQPTADGLRRASAAHDRRFLRRPPVERHRRCRDRRPARPPSTGPPTTPSRN